MTSLDITLGAVLVGYTFATLLLGVATVQVAYAFFISSPNLHFALSWLSAGVHILQALPTWLRSKAMGNDGINRVSTNPLYGS